jgi:protease-4
MAENPVRKPNFFVRLMRFLWGSVNFARRLVFGALAVFILLGVLAGLGGKGPTLSEKTALVIAPKGAIVEQYSGSPADRALSKALGDEVPETQLRDILRAIDGAARDPNIDRIVLVTDGLFSVGYSTLIEIGAALKRFKTSGKEIIAYGDAFEQRGYYLAAHADKVYLHPEGAVLLEGIGRYRTYFKDAFDKFGVEARLFRVGEYKSAGEPYIRSDASPEAKEADLYWMGDLWQRFLADISTLRKIEDGKLAADIDDYVNLIKSHSGDLAKLALDQKLVDELKTRDELRAMLIEKGALDDEEKTFRQIAVDDYAKFLANADLLAAGKPAVGVVVAEGEIVDGDQSPGMIGGDSTARLIREAREDENIKAVVLRVDSPGGGVFPSEVIRREVELTKAAGKPVIVSMGDLAASGGYWISMNADKIIASPSTITGSIGIFGLWVNYPQAIGKLGLRTDGSATTWIAGAIDPSREYDPRLGEVIQSVIDRGYQQFIGKVAGARGKTSEEIDQIARGRVWSGAQAKDRGLVDELGTFDDAVKAAASAASLSDWRVQYVEKERSPFELAMADLLSSRVGGALAAGGLAGGWMPRQQLDEIARAQRVLADAAGARPAAMYAHCECDAR